VSMGLRSCGAANLALDPMHQIDLNGPIKGIMAWRLGLLEGAREAQRVRHAAAHPLFSAPNGVELYWDRPREQWPRSPDGRLTMFTRALDVDSLLAELSSK
jgi:hypothetical protein